MTFGLYIFTSQKDKTWKEIWHWGGGANLLTGGAVRGLGGHVPPSLYIKRGPGPAPAGTAKIIIAIETPINLKKGKFPHSSL